MAEWSDSGIESANVVCLYVAYVGSNPIEAASLAGPISNNVVVIGET